MDDDNHVVIGMDPLKRSVTIEVMTSDEQVIGGGRFRHRRRGIHLDARLRRGMAGPGLAIEGCEGIGRQSPSA